MADCDPAGQTNFPPQVAFHVLSQNRKQTRITSKSLPWERTHSGNKDITHLPLVHRSPEGSSSRLFARELCSTQSDCRKARAYVQTTAKRFSNATWRYTSYCSWRREIEARSHCCSGSQWLCVSRLLWPSPFRMHFRSSHRNIFLTSDRQSYIRERQETVSEIRTRQKSSYVQPDTKDRQNSQPAFKNNRRTRHSNAYCSLSTWEVEAGGLLS